MTSPLVHLTDQRLTADPTRVVARLFLPGEQPQVKQSRASVIVTRLLDLDEPTVERLATEVRSRFDTRHPHFLDLLSHHASIVIGHAGERPQLSEARALVLGACFTAEYATEAAALCNPSAFLAPDQSGLADGQARVVLSLRAIGEGHVSSIGFCLAVLGPGPSWSFDTRSMPLATGIGSPGTWRLGHLQAVLDDHGVSDELSHFLMHQLPDEFTGADLEEELARVPTDLLLRTGGHASVDLLRRIVSSGYDMRFAEDTSLAQRVLMPVAEDETGGMEDARFTSFERTDGQLEYRATYTAYDGREIVPRMLVSEDLLHFRMHRLAGAAARNKGMALFPRLVNGEYVALCRTDGETLSLTRSPDGFVWSEPALVHGPSQPWEILQVGNCGSPIETDRGWLVLTHGVGVMRTYVIGALLLDLVDPSQVIGALRDPLLSPRDDERDGYVPNVVYSCGGIVHDGVLWLPYGMDDSRIGVAWIRLDELLDALVATPVPH